MQVPTVSSSGVSIAECLCLFCACEESDVSFAVGLDGRYKLQKFTSGLVKISSCSVPEAGPPMLHPSLLQAPLEPFRGLGRNTGSLIGAA